MKKKLLSIIAAFVIAVTVWVPAAAGEADAATKITPRTSLPSYTSDIGKKYYYTDDNVFYKYNYGPNLKYLSSRKGYVRGNCTWYAYARASEILGTTFNPAFRYSAYRWYSINKSGKYYPYGSTPKVGAIACYSNHVAIVEKIENGKVYVSESGWRIGAKPTTASQIYFHYGTPWYSKATGYIYITEGTTATTTAPTYTTTAANYKVKITAKDLNMRTGPATSYPSKGYVTPGTYTINAESNGWGKLSSNGYWVKLSYTTKVTTTTTTTTTANATTAATTTKATTTKATTTQAASTETKYKVTATDLNMRTGPGTTYQTKGYIKPGTYVISQIKDGWGKLSTNGYWIMLKYATKVTTSTTKATTTKATTTKATTTKATTTKATTTKATSETATTGAKFKVKITGSGLAMRTGAGTSYKKKGTVTKGKVYAIKKVKNGWGQLSSNGYWIKLSYTKLSGTSKVKITAKDLNMRTGAGTKYKSKGYVKTGSHKIKAIKNGWVQLSSNGYWVKMSYVKFV